MVNNVEQRVYELLRPYAGTYLFKFKKVELTPETDLDTDLSLDDLEAGELMDKFFDAFKVERGKFKIETYYPDQPVSWNPFGKTDPIPVPDFNVGMLIESAKAGRLCTNNGRIAPSKYSSPKKQCCAEPFPISVRVKEECTQMTSVDSE